jgi:hypothetical protein
MTHIIEEQELYLQTTKQIIIQNLNGIDEEISLEVESDVDMDGEGTTLIEMFKKHLDNRGNARSNDPGV